MKRRIFKRLTFKSFLKIGGTAFRQWRKREPFTQSAVIAYFAIFSIPGLLFMVISFVSLFFQKDAIAGHLYNQVSSVMGPETAKQIESMVLSAGQHSKGFIPAIIGLITILIRGDRSFCSFTKSTKPDLGCKAKTAS